MEKNNIDNLLKKAIQRIDLEKPSNDFTQKVMIEVEKSQIKTSLTYKSIFPNYIKIGLAGVFFSLIIYLSQTRSGGFNTPFDFIKLPRVDWDIFQLGYEMPKFILYSGIIFLAGYILQIYYLNLKMNKLGR